MTAYRIYIVDADGYVDAPPQILECANDQEAIRRARQYLDSKPVEVWEGGTCVSRLKPKETKAAHHLHRVIKD